MYTAFHPGKTWLDTNGRPIQAHGGSILTVDGVHYWYGENKERTTGDGKVWHWGMRAYSSTDLYNWEDRGIIVPPVLDDPSSSLAPRSGADRPHIVRSPATGRFVCWIKIMSPDTAQQSMTILEADHIVGPYRVIREGYRPAALSAGDFDLVVDEATGRGYIYFENPHSRLICADLTDDLTATTGSFTEHFTNRKPPYTREAPASFSRDGRRYLITSGTSGYFPNPSEVAEADDWHGPFRVLGDPHPRDRSRTSYHSQISSVFRIPDRENAYIALADRWLPRMRHVPFLSAMVRKGTERAFAGDGPKHDPATPAEPDRNNTSISTYVWLPLQFDGDIPTLDWRRSWSLDDAFPATVPPAASPLTTH